MERITIRKELGMLVDQLRSQKNPPLLNLRIGPGDSSIMVSGEPCNTQTPGTTLSFVIQYDEKEDTFFTYPGNISGSFDDAKERLIYWYMNGGACLENGPGRI